MTAPHVNGGVAAGTIAGAAVGWNVANVGAVSSQTATAYGVSLATVGLFTTALFVTHLAMQVPGGRLVDALGARHVCTIGLLIVIAGTSISMIAPQPALGIGARALTGVGTGLGFIAGTAYIRRSGGSPFAQGLYGGISLGAGGIALAVVPRLVPELAWRAPYASALVLAIVGLAVLVPAPLDRAAGPSAQPARSAGVLRDTGLYRLAVLFSATFGLTVVLGNWVVELLEREGISEAGAGSIGATILTLGIVSRPLGGWVLRSHGAQTRRVVSFALLAGGAGSVLLALAGSPTVAVLGCLLLGIGGGIAFAPAFTGAAALRPDAPAAAVGFVNAVAAATVLVLTPILGLTFSLPGDGRLGFAAAAPIWFAALAVLPDRRSLGVSDAEDPEIAQRTATRARSNPAGSSRS
ncbi:MAG: MFS transporter [Solirubrobacterales bacterium]